MIKYRIGKSIEIAYTSSLNKRNILLNMQKLNEDSKYNPGDDSG